MRVNSILSHSMIHETLCHLLELITVLFEWLVYAMEDGSKISTLVVHSSLVMPGFISACRFQTTVLPHCKLLVDFEYRGILLARTTEFKSTF